MSIHRVRRRRAPFVLALIVVGAWTSLSSGHAHAAEEGAGQVRIERSQGPRRRAQTGTPDLPPREVPADWRYPSTVEPEDRAARGNGGNGM